MRNFRTLFGTAAITMLPGAGVADWVEDVADLAAGAAGLVADVTGLVMDGVGLNCVADLIAYFTDLDADVDGCMNKEPGSSLILPMGSYLAHVDLSSIFYAYERLHLIENQPYCGTEWIVQTGRGRGAVNITSCWQDGYDIAVSRRSGLYCNKEKKRTVINAATYLYSQLVPQGTYLKRCKGVLKTSENGRDILYAACRKDIFDCTTLDITGCEPGKIQTVLTPLDPGNGYVYPTHEALICKNDEAPYFPQLVSGSYLESGCQITETEYDSEADRLTTQCSGQQLSLDQVAANVQSGMDIIYDQEQLRFSGETGVSARIHTASPYVPRGVYLLSCTKIAYYPCLGRKGTLVAHCFNRRQRLQGSVMENSDDLCGYKFIANKNGQLQCDSDCYDMEKDPIAKDVIRVFECSE